MTTKLESISKDDIFTKDFLLLLSLMSTTIRAALVLGALFILVVDSWLAKFLIFSYLSIMSFIELSHHKSKINPTLDLIAEHPELVKRYISYKTDLQKFSVNIEIEIGRFDEIKEMAKSLAVYVFTIEELELLKDTLLYTHWFSFKHKL